MQLIKILDENNEINTRQFDDLIEYISENQGIAVIDNGAATFIPLMSYLAENAILEMFNHLDIKVFFHVPIQGGQALPDTLLGLQGILKFSVSVIVWLNHHVGKIVQDGQQFTDFKIYQNHHEKILGIIELPMRNLDTFGLDIKNMTEQHLTVNEVISSKDWHLMPKQRILSVYKDISRQLTQLEFFIEEVADA